MDIPELIRARRLVLGLSARKLGLKCGYKECSAKYVVLMWESGKQGIPAARLRAVAAALEIPVTALIPK